MTDAERSRYVEASLLVNGFAFTADRVAVIDREFARIAAIAATFVDEALPIDAEPAVVFRP